MKSILSQTGKWGLNLSTIAALVLSIFNTIGGKTGPAPDPRPAPQGPFVTLPERINVQAGQMFVVQAETNCKNLDWSSDSGLKFVDQSILNPAANAQVGIAAVPGQYRILVHAALADVPVKSNECIVMVTGGQSPPNPSPAPQPSPSPTPQPSPLPPPEPAPPKSDKLKIVIIDDATRRPFWVAQIINDTAFRAAVKAAGHEMTFSDLTNPGVKSFVTRASGKPSIFVISWWNGDLFNSGSYDLPHDAAGVAEMINRYTTKPVDYTPKSSPQAAIPPPRRVVDVTVYVQDNCPPCEQLKRDVAAAPLVEIDGARVETDFRFTFTRESPGWAAALGRPTLAWRANGRERYTVGWNDFVTFYRIWQRAEDETGKVASR